MQCSKETIVRLFYNASSSFQLLFLFFYLTSTFLSKLLFFISSIPFLTRNNDEYEYATFSEEEQEEEEEGEEEDNEVISNRYYYDDSTTKDDLLADISREGEEDLFVLQTSARSSRQNSVVFDEEIVYDYLESPKEKEEEVADISVVSSEDTDFYSLSESEYEEDSNQQINNHYQGKEEDDEISVDLGSKSLRYEVNTPAITTRARSACTSFRYVGDEPSLRVTKKIAFVLDDDKINEKYRETGKKIESKLTQVEKFPNIATLNSKRFELEENDKEEIFGDTNTVGSTSKSSSEWRSSINCRDPSYDPFSSSSRRSCPKWESYTVFQKYDEEMLFLDRISVQKLQETESFRSSTTHQSSISEKIIHKLASRNKKTSYVYQNSYHELEAAYVAQICLTWEALNWNYNYFQQLRASRRESDPGCPAYIAQQFQQFQVLLQRYVENEPYENGRRPIVYARMRSLAPKLLQVPEYRDSDDEKKDEYLGSRISSESFLVIMDESIKTFMNFLRADKESHFHKFTAHFFPIKNPRTSVDPTHILLLKKINHKKKLKLKDLQRSRKCFLKRKSKHVNEMEVLMSQIDLKIVSRVLRTSDLNEEQMHWCEDKMTKVKVYDGKLQRDSSPLFFPAH
ncbi:hypothetical protein CTI12_AA543480 [Artemisia annua]|uniref:Ribosomal protein L34Ae n=1 Tax=Artemisia annua TaxID=35608 RepID=A0A2U1L0K2_ARTAN|nr:hypothetical protein CTI12_AA543480 [Artemisia annua]